MRKVILVSSIGGHLEQLLLLKRVIKESEATIVTERNNSSLYLQKKYDSVFYLPYLSRKSKVDFFYHFLLAFYQSIKLYRRIRPDLIISTGAACAIPMCFLGRVFGAKVIFIETFSRIHSKTLTGAVCYYLAHIFIVQWEELLDKYPRAYYLGSIY